MKRTGVWIYTTAGLSKWMETMTHAEKDKTADIILTYKRDFQKHKIPAKPVAKILDKWVKHTYKIKGNNKISCKKGCYYCCRIEAILCQSEIDRINRYINRYYIDPIKNQEDNRCPFLNSDNICNIYPVRPASCRKYLVISPVEWCNSLDPKNKNAKIAVISDVSIEILVTGLWQIGKTMDIREAFK